MTDWVDTVFAECGNGCMRSGIDGWLYPSNICGQHWPMGTCAGPSWDPHEPFKVATGNPCPRCGTVMVDVRCNVRLASVPPPHDRCLSADWPNHHHVFGALP